MTAMFYDKDRSPIKTVHFGATGYLNYTIALFDEDRRNRYIKIHVENRIGRNISLQVRYQDICMGI